MPFREFESNDIFYNRVKTFPKCEFVINDSKIYFNGLKNFQGKFNELHATPQGFVSLYELNVDRTIDKGTGQPPDGKSIYPFITKGGSRIAFKTISTSEFDSSSQFEHGDVVKGDYPLTSSIKRTKFTQTTETFVTVNNEERFHGSYVKLTSNKRFINALKNSFNEYIKHSHHYSFDDTTNPMANATADMGLRGWDKSKQEMSLIEIPSIFYGSSIKKGSVVLQTYYTGTLVSECRDTKRNGELIQVSGTYNAAKNNNKVAGLILYNEGFLAMTGSWQSTAAGITDNFGGGQSTFKWRDFGAGANDGLDMSSKTTFRIKFEGVNYVPTVTMFAHAPKGEFNNSTHPTSFESGSVRNPLVSGRSYREHKGLKFSKLEHGDYSTTSSYVKQTYISKIGIYDESKRLIGIATLANPVRKTEDREYTFKLKLDF